MIIFALLSLVIQIPVFQAGEDSYIDLENFPIFGSGNDEDVIDIHLDGEYLNIKTSKGLSISARRVEENDLYRIEDHNGKVVRGNIVL